jgi:hypothetical protein
MARPTVWGTFADLASSAPRDPDDLRDTATP